LEKGIQILIFISTSILNYQRAFGKVVKAKHKESGFELAVKVVPTSKERRETLEKEIEVLKKCKSPNILSYYGTLSTASELWVQFEIIFICNGLLNVS
jgi:serine/threonine protein kinase